MGVEVVVEEKEKAWFISSVGGNKIVTVDITGDNRLLQKRLEDILRQ